MKQDWLPSKLTGGNQTKIAFLFLSYFINQSFCLPWEEICFCTTSVPAWMCPLVPAKPSLSEDLLFSWSTSSEILHSHLWSFLIWSSPEQYLAKTAVWYLFFYLSSPGICSVFHLKLIHTEVKSVILLAGYEVRGKWSMPQLESPICPCHAARVASRKAKAIPSCCNSKIYHRVPPALHMGLYNTDLPKKGSKMSACSCALMQRCVSHSPCYSHWSGSVLMPRDVIVTPSFWSSGTA